MGLFDSFFGGGDDVELPPAPDPGKLLQDQAQANRIDQFSPFGSLTFSGGPYRNRAEFTLNPRLQALLDSQIAGSTGAADRAGAFIGGASPVALTPADQVASQVFELGLGGIQPVFDQRRQRLQEQLTQSGNPGTGADLAPGAVSELDMLGRQENQLLRELAISSALAVPDYQGRMVNNQATAATTNANIGLGFSAAGRELIPGLNDFYAPAGLDVNGAYQTANNYAIQANQIQQQRDSDFLGGLFDLGMVGIDFATGGASLPFTSAARGARGSGGNPLGLAAYGVF